MVYFVLLGLYTTNIYAAASLGIQMTVGVVNMVTLWLCTGPAVLVFAVWLGGGIEAAWTTLLPSYAVMNAIVFVRLATFDWEAFGEQVKERETKAVSSAAAAKGDDGDASAPASESTPLV